MIKNRFSISTKDEFEESKLETEIAFSDPKKSSNFFHLYCHLCEKNKMSEIWKKHNNLLTHEITLKYFSSLEQIKSSLDA